MWKLAPTDEYARRLKWYTKKHPRELKAALDNPDTFHKALNRGAKPIQAKFGFVHTEPKGVLAIDQKGGGSNLKQTRLYVLAEEEFKTLHLITLGDKKTQKDDIRFCKEFVENLQTERNDGDQDEEERAV